MATIRDLIGGSMRLIEELGAGEYPSAESAADGLTALNGMISSWSIQGDLVYTETVETFNLTGNDGIYTIGPTGDLVTTRPSRITAVTVNDGAIDIPLTMYSIDQYASIADKTATGIPDSIYIDYNFPNLTVKLYPMPSQAYTMTVYSEKPLSEYSAIGDTLTVPPGYERALRYNLAMEIAPEYGKQASATVMKIAIESKNAIRSQNNRADNDKMSVDDALQAGDGFNIYSGYNSR